MKKIFIIIVTFVSLTLTLSGLSLHKESFGNVEKNLSAMIRDKDYPAIETFCAEIAAQDSTERDHMEDVRLLKIAIDSLCPEALESFYANEIAYFDPKSDSISPLDYFYGDKFEKRFADNLHGKDSSGRQDVWERLYWTSQILLGFQELNIDSLYFSKIDSKFNSLKKFEND